MLPSPLRLWDLWPGKGTVASEPKQGIRLRDSAQRKIKATGSLPTYRSLIRNGGCHWPGRDRYAPRDANGSYFGCATSQKEHLILARMKFITLDFETANRDRTSACEIGLTFVENGTVGETKSWLIRPVPNDFDYFNVLLHGIRPEMVENESTFDAIWSEVKPLLEGQFVIAHNAGFDMSVLRRTLDQFAIPLPALEYACSYIFSKRVWEGLPSYGLRELCSMNSIDFKHHRAGPDSRATAQLALRAFEVSGVGAIDELPVKLKTTVGAFFPGGYTPCRAKNQSDRWRQPNISSLVGDPAKHNPDSIFYGHSVVFTGALSSMPRTEAQQAILDVGGKVTASVTKTTDFLVVGQQDHRLVGDDGMSNKQAKAILLKQAGAPIEILSEADFLQSL